MLKHIDFQRIKKILLQIPRWVGENVFFGFIILLFFALIISAFVFYKYVFSARDADINTQIIQTKFQEQTFQKVLDIWEMRRVEFQNAGNETARNIFAPPLPVQEEEPGEELTEE